ncbi:hypothetical protein METBIDRAFT_153317 [Metschnikowia bicuspidata var. bicuspidata NRRL YB-4993]|uniref:Uncharacterized protein n=1 Tax=Metschnikowia bicuspidata var. bicuspidata NRRL YB-4993 TaxID=869754 RepID=A0A1A0HET8_9ASCO|nr:hypothetical protein METBIDRAFT_153317 [Metschnikowia bicuspidata var. bicuspidata NRRL YB-4993]OBA22423.1 hypothetical protein METBIDRAFT_153317 [Metschnikowia bicuspidata var. bicuspidata NRRL YB-4993]
MHIHSLFKNISLLSIKPPSYKLDPIFTASSSICSFKLKRSAFDNLGQGCIPVFVLWFPNQGNGRLGGQSSNKRIGATSTLYREFRCTASGYSLTSPIWKMTEIFSDYESNSTVCSSHARPSRHSLGQVRAKPLVPPHFLVFVSQPQRHTYRQTFPSRSVVPGTLINPNHNAILVARTTRCAQNSGPNRKGLPGPHTNRPFANVFHI